MSVICVSIADKERAEEWIKKYEFVEIRADLMHLTLEELKHLLKIKKKAIVTAHNISNEKELLEKAVEWGADYIDIDVGKKENYFALVRKALEKKVKIILSYHNFEGTPEKSTLEKIIEENKGYIVKIATKVNSTKDALTLLSLLEKKDVIVVGMGKKGRVVRVVAPLLGGLFTFSYPEGGKSTAEGQLSYERMKKIMEELEC